MSLRFLSRRLLPSLAASCWVLFSPLETWAETISRQVVLMGTWLEIEVNASDHRMALEISTAALDAIRATDERLSTWRPDSELAALNRQPVGRWTAISPELATDLEAALWCSDRTGGAFQPVMAPLIAAWDLRGPGRIPGARELGDALAACRADSFEIEGLAARRLSPDAAIEEGAFGKGAALRDAAASLGAASDACMTLNFGGQIMRSGACAAASIELAHPDARQRRIAWLTLGEGSVASSGQSERRRLVDGHDVGHILDPRNGHPVPAWGSVSVVHPDPMTADCLATALFVMGPARGTTWLLAHPEVEAVLIIVEAWGTTLRATPGLTTAIQPLASTTRVMPLTAHDRAAWNLTPHTNTPGL